MATRRELLQAGAGIAAATWAAPSVLAVDRVSAASPSSACEVPMMGNNAAWSDNPPALLVPGSAFDSNINTYVFAEQGPIELTADLSVNRTTAGNFNGSSNPGGVIPLGTVICSYFVHGDRLDNRGFLTGSLTFSNAVILGLIYRTNDFPASSAFERPGVTYEYGGMEGSDTMSFDGGTTLSWSMRFGGHVDQIRVITSCP